MSSSWIPYFSKFNVLSVFILYGIQSLKLATQYTSPCGSNLVTSSVIVAVIFIMLSFTLGAEVTVVLKSVFVAPAASETSSPF